MMVAEPFPPTEESIARFYKAGWSVGDDLVLGEDDTPVCLVTGHKGDARIRAEDSTEREAWWAATVAAGVNG